MEKIAVLIVAFICIFGLSGCVPAPGSSGPGRPIAAYIADDVTKAEITHRSGGTAEEWTVEGEDEPIPEKRTPKEKKKWNEFRCIRYPWLGSGAAQFSLKTRGGNPTQSRVRAEGVVESFQIGKHIALRRRSGRILL